MNLHVVTGRAKGFGQLRPELALVFLDTKHDAQTMTVLTTIVIALAWLTVIVTLHSGVLYAFAAWRLLRDH